MERTDVRAMATMMTMMRKERTAGREVRDPGQRTKVRNHLPASR